MKTPVLASNILYKNVRQHLLKSSYFLGTLVQFMETFNIQQRLYRNSQVHTIDRNKASENNVFLLLFSFFQDGSQYLRGSAGTLIQNSHTKIIYTLKLGDGLRF